MLVRGGARPARDVGRGQREDRVLAVAGDDHQRAGAHPLEHVVRLHRADRHAVDDAVEVRARVDHAPVDAREDHPERRVGQDRPVRQDPQERDPVEGQAALQRPRDARLLVDPHLVHQGARDRHAVRGEVRGVEHDLVDRPADAALRHDHRRRPQHRRDRRVRQPHDGTHPRVPGALDQQDVVIRELAVGRHDPGAQVLHHVARDVGLREAARDVDRAHHRERLRQAEGRPHQEGVLVGRLAVQHDRALADGLHEPRAQAAPEEAVDQPEGGRGLAAVLAGGGEVEVPHGLGRAPAGGRVSRGERSCAR